MTRNKSSFDPQTDPHVLITVQPTPHPIRFRYECEGRNGGTIPGESCQNKAKTFPTIKIVNYTGSVVIVASCVTKSKPYHPHPNKLVGKDGCENGISTVKMEVSPSNNEFVYRNLGVQCVRKTDVDASMDIRKQIKVDPFLTGFESTDKIQMDVVRICFQVFLRIERPDGTVKNVPLRPVVTTPIYDKKYTNDLLIVKTSEPIGPAEGGSEMILLCEKVAKEDIQVRFFKKIKDEIVWCELADLRPHDVHRQVAMSFRTPAYPKIQDDPVEVLVELHRPSDGQTSSPFPYHYLPYGYSRNNTQIMKRKFSKVDRSKELLDYAVSVIPRNKKVTEAVNNNRVSHHRDQPYIVNIPNQINDLPQSYDKKTAPNKQKRRVITPNQSTIQPKKEPKLTAMIGESIQATDILQPQTAPSNQFIDISESNTYPMQPSIYTKENQFDQNCLVDAILNQCSPAIIGESIQATDILQPQTAPSHQFIDISESNTYPMQPSIYAQPSEFENWNQFDTDLLFDNTPLQQQYPFQTTNNQEAFPTHHQILQPNYGDQTNQMQNQPDQQQTQPMYPQLSNVSFANQTMNHTEHPLNFLLNMSDDTIHKFEPFTPNLCSTKPIAGPQSQQLHQFQEITELPHQTHTTLLPETQFPFDCNDLRIQAALEQLGKQQPPQPSGNQSAPDTSLKGNGTETMENMTDSLSSLSVTD